MTTEPQKYKYGDTNLPVLYEDESTLVYRDRKTDEIYIENKLANGGTVLICSNRDGLLVTIFGIPTLLVVNRQPAILVRDKD